MPRHFTPEDLDRFAGGTLSPVKRRRFVRHLLRGCPSCSNVLSMREKLAAARSFDNAYDSIISRSIAKASRKAKARQAAVAVLTSLLSGERTWTELSSSDLATLHGLPQILALIDAGRSLRHHDAQAMLRFARLARYAADRFSAREIGARSVADLRALAWGELSNAYRICDDLSQASRAMNRAVYWSHRGSRSGLLLARIADLLASLLASQRRFAEAVQLLCLVHGIHAQEGRPHLAGRALISMGHFTAWDGAPGKAIVLLERGLDQIDPRRDPALVANTLHAMVWFLVDLGRFRTARRLLWSFRILVLEHGNALELVRLRWLEGRIYAGLSDFSRAELAFQETRAGFAKHEQVYPAAIAGLDLAALWARQGRFTEIHSLAQEMIATFRALRIAREAIVTLVILQRACLSGEGQLLEIIDMVVTFLKDLERQPAKRS